MPSCTLVYIVYIVYIILLFSSCTTSLPSLEDLYEFNFHFSASILDIAGDSGLNIGIPRNKDGHHQCVSMPIAFEFVPMGALERLLSIPDGGVYTEFDDLDCAFRSIGSFTNQDGKNFKEGECIEPRMRLKGAECDRDLRMHLERSEAISKLYTLRDYRRTSIQYIHRSIVMKNLLNRIQDISKNNTQSTISGATTESSTGSTYIKSYELSIVLEEHVKFAQNSLFSEQVIMISEVITILDHINLISSKYQIPIPLKSKIIEFSNQLISNFSIDNLSDIMQHDDSSIKLNLTQLYIDFKCNNDKLISMIHDFKLWAEFNSIYSIPGDLNPHPKEYTMRYFGYVNMLAVILNLFTKQFILYDRIFLRDALKYCKLNQCYISSNITNDITLFMQSITNNYSLDLNLLNYSCLKSIQEELGSLFSNFLQEKRVQNSTEIAFKMMECMNHAFSSELFQMNIKFNKTKALLGFINESTTVLQWEDQQMSFTLFSLVANLSKLNDVIKIGENGTYIDFQTIVSFFINNFFKTPTEEPLLLNTKLKTSILNQNNNVEFNEMNIIENLDEFDENTCEPGKFWSALLEDCEIAPKGYWADKSLKYLCSNAKYPNIAYNQRGESTSNCSFVCEDELYRVQDDCKTPPNGKYPIDGGFELGDCFNPENMFTFISPGKTGDQLSCKFIAKTIATVKLDNTFIPSKNFTISTVLKFDTNQINTILEIDPKNDTDTGIITNVIMFIKSEIGFGFRFFKNETSIQCRMIFGDIESTNVEIISQEMIFEVDEYWHEYSIVHNENMHSIAFFRDGKYLGSHWFLFPESFLNLNESILKLGGEVTNNIFENIPNTWFLPAQMQSINLLQFAESIDFTRSTSFSNLCSNGSYWGEYSCFSCPEYGMDLDGNNFDQEICRCPFGKYLDRLEDKITCKWCPIQAIGSDGVQCDCIEGYSWIPKIGICEPSKESYPPPTLNLNYIGDNFKFSELNSTINIPQKSMIIIGAPENVKENNSNTTLLCKIIKGKNDLYLENEYSIDDLPITIQLDKVERYALSCFFKETKRLNGVPLSRIINVKKRLPHLHYVHPNGTSNGPVALVLSTTFNPINSHELYKIMYSVNISNSLTDITKTNWILYSSTDPPLLLYSQEVAFYLQSISDEYISGPITIDKWIIEISQLAFDSENNEMNNAIIKNDINEIVNYLQTNYWILIIVGMIFLVLSLCFGMVIGGCCILFRIRFLLNNKNLSINNKYKKKKQYLSKERSFNDSQKSMKYSETNSHKEKSNKKKRIHKNKNYNKNYQPEDKDILYGNMENKFFGIKMR